MKDQAKRDAQTVQITSMLFAVTFAGGVLFGLAALLGLDGSAIALLLSLLLVLFVFRVVRVARLRQRRASVLLCR